MTEIRGGLLVDFKSLEIKQSGHDLRIAAFVLVRKIVHDRRQGSRLAQRVQQIRLRAAVVAPLGPERKVVVGGRRASFQ